MLDACIIERYSRAYDGYGSEVITYTSSGLVKCGLEQRPGFERHDRTKTTVEYDAILRLPIGTAINVKDRVKIVNRFGTAADSVYEVASPIQQGASGLRILLKRVET